MMLTEAQEREVARIDAGESLWDESVPIEEPLEFRQPLGKVVSMRLTDRQWQALYAEARELGVGPTTLARMWVLKELRASGILGQATPTPVREQARNTAGLRASARD
jgi:hypothetical protein